MFVSHKLIMYSCFIILFQSLNYKTLFKSYNDMNINSFKEAKFPRKYFIYRNRNSCPKHNTPYSLICEKIPDMEHQLNKIHKTVLLWLNKDNLLCHMSIT